jgi:excisionase family DNA binding protein
LVAKVSPWPSSKTASATAFSWFERWLRVSNMTVYRLIKAGDLPAIRVGKNFRIRRSDVESYLGDRSYGG